MFSIMQKQMPSTLQHSFSQQPRARTPRSQFRRTHEFKGTFNADYLVPFYWDLVYPADTAPMNFTALCRMVTPETPFMDNLYIDTFFFYVPLRLLQTNFVKLMGERFNPEDSIDFSTPKVTSPVGGYVGPSNWLSPTAAELSGSLYDYFGYPTRVAGVTAHNYLARAYNLIWNEWFRDENLQTRVPVPLNDGPDTYTDFKLLKRGKRKDYFTSCLPWLQKGTAENLPIGTSAPVKSPNSTSNVARSVSTAAPNAVVQLNNAGVVSTGSDFYADLSVATGVTIAALYRSFAIQDLLQTDARGGTRFVEILNAHFGVTVPDYRLQRPEYLGGSSIPFVISPLAQTSQTATTELGTLAATAAASLNIGFFKSFVEHGVVIGMMAVRADLTYQQGLHRTLSVSTRYDFYFPAFANLAEMPVYNKEIMAQGTAADDQVFGYQERWAELRYGKTIIADRMRSNHPQSLDIWHLAQDFSTLPALNAAFIESNAGAQIERVVAVTTEPQFKIDIYGVGNWARPLPTYSVPGLLNRF